VQVEVTGYTSATPSASAATGDTAVATTNATGSFTASLTLRTRGTVMIGAYVAGGPSRDAEAARAIALAPNARVVGVAGSRFLPGRLLQLSGEGWPTGPVTAAVCSPTCGPGALLSADDDGVVDGSLAIPADLGPGSYVVRLTADAVQATTSPFTIAAPTVARTGTERVEPGGSLAVSGSNWPDGAVSVQFCPTIDTCLAAASTIEVGAEGDFAPGASVTVPDAVSAGSSGLLRFTSGVFEAAEFVSLPPPPSIVVSPSSVQVGDEASVLGSGWEPGSVVTLSLARSSTDEPLAASTDVTADSNGAFQADVAVASPLTKRIIARSGSLSASGTILVVEDPVTTVPSAWITAVAGQGTGSFLARPGDQIELRGVAWTGPRTSSQITARLCSDSGSNCSTVLTSALSVDSAGVLTGAVNLPPSLGVGSWGIRVSSGAQTAVAPVGVASSSLPTLEVSESVVPWGRTVTVTGTGWSGLGPLQVRGFVTPTAFGESADAPVSFSSGSFSVTFLIRDKRTTAIGVVANGGASRTPYLARPVEVVVGAGIGQVLGQLNGVTGYARAGNGLSIEGDLWPVDLAVGTIGARFCSGPWSCIEQPTNTLATDGQARLSGTVPLPVGLPTGLSVLELTAGGGAPVQIPFTVLGPPRAATVGELDLGQPLPVTGYDFDPGTIVYIYGLEFGTAGAGFRGMVRPMPTASASLQGTSDPTVTAVVGPDGSFTVDYVVNDPDTITIGVYGGVAGAPPVVGSPPTTTYDVVEAQLDQCVVPDPDPTGEGCSTEQRVSATVIPGSLIQQAQPTGANASATAVDLGQMTVSSTPEVLSGELNSITVTDTRGGQSVWSLTAFLAGLSEPGGGSIAASAVVLTPSCSVNASGSAPGAVAGDPGQNLGTTATLCVKNGDVGLGGSTSGQYVIASPVDLTVPAFQKAGNYTGTIVITLT
jgi:hypothetical protein